MTASSFTLIIAWGNSVKICALSLHYESATVSWCACEEAAEENVAHLIRRHLVTRFTAAPLRRWSRVLLPLKGVNSSLQQRIKSVKFGYPICLHTVASLYQNVLASRRITYVSSYLQRNGKAALGFFCPMSYLSTIRFSRLSEILQSALWSTEKYCKMLKNRRFWVKSWFCNYLALASWTKLIFWVCTPFPQWVNYWRDSINWDAPRAFSTGQYLNTQVLFLCVHLGSVIMAFIFISLVSLKDLL